MSRIVMLRMNDLDRDVRVERTANALAEAGHEVTVLGVEGECAASFERRDGWDIRRVAKPGRASWRTPLAKLRELRSRSTALISAAVELAPNFVHAQDADTFVAAAAIAERTSARFVADAGELYPEMLLANRAHTPRPVLWYWSATEARGLRIADAVVTVGDAIAEEFTRRYGVRPEILRNVPVLEPLGDRLALRTRLGIGSDGVLLFYQGLINRGRGIDQMMTAVAEVPNTHLVLQGAGPLLDEYLARAAASPAADRIHYAGFVPLSELNLWASGADIGAVLIENTSLNNYLSSPNKLYQYLMAGIPMLGSDFPDIGRVIGDGQCGTVCDPSSQTSVTDALRLLAAMTPSHREAMGQRARHLAETRYNWDIEKLRLLAIYDRLAASSTA